MEQSLLVRMVGEEWPDNINPSDKSNTERNDFAGTVNQQNCNSLGCTEGAFREHSRDAQNFRDMKNPEETVEDDIQVYDVPLTLLSYF